jgi:hypothetical protein
MFPLFILSITQHLLLGNHNKQLPTTNAQFPPTNAQFPPTNAAQTIEKLNYLVGYNNVHKTRWITYWLLLNNILLLMVK